MVDAGIAVEIYRHLQENNAKMQVADFKDLYYVSLLQDRGTPGYLRQAMELAQQNKHIQGASLTTLDVYLGLKQTQRTGR